MAAALVEMVVAFDRSEDGSVADAGARAATLRARALELADADLASYRPVIEALRLPADDPARAGAVTAALTGAAQVPLSIAELAAEVAQLAADCAERAGRHPVGDAATASVLAAAACRAAAMLVSLNLQGSSDDRPGQAAELAEQAAVVSQHALGKAHGG